ncbi:MAG: hypothetical protein ACWA41_00410 [Putridiphycobacter sp.]
MKTRLITLIVSILIMLSAQHKVIAQSDKLNKPFAVLAYTGVGIMDANIKIGIPFQRGDAKLVGLPVAMGIKGESKINKKLSMHLDLNFVHTGVDYYNKINPLQLENSETEYHRRTSTKLRTMIGLSYYYLNTIKKQRYIVISLGAKFVSRKYTVDGVQANLFYEFPNLTINSENEFVNPAIRLGIGFKRQISSNMFFSGELGLGSNPVQFGIGVRF